MCSATSWNLTVAGARVATLWLGHCQGDGTAILSTRSFSWLVQCNLQRWRQDRICKKLRITDLLCSELCRRKPRGFQASHEHTRPVPNGRSRNMPSRPLTHASLYSLRTGTYTVNLQPSALFAGLHPPASVWNSAMHACLDHDSVLDSCSSSRSAVRYCSQEFCLLCTWILILSMPSRNGSVVAPA